MAKNPTEKVQQVRVKFEKATRYEPRTVAINVKKYVPSGGPDVIIANATESKHQRQPGQPAGHWCEQRYLCPSCGQDGAIGREWISFVQFEGDVRCPRRVGIQ